MDIYARIPRNGVCRKISMCWTGHNLDTFRSVFVRYGFDHTSYFLSKRAKISDFCFKTFRGLLYRPPTNRPYKPFICVWEGGIGGLTAQNSRNKTNVRKIGHMADTIQTTVRFLQVVCKLYYMTTHVKYNICTCWVSCTYNLLCLVFVNRSLMIVNKYSIIKHGFSICKQWGWV